MPDKDIDKIPITVEVPKADVWVRNDYRDIVRRLGEVHMIRACEHQHDDDFVPLYDIETLARYQIELERLRADAERYRFLRTGTHWPCVFADHDDPEPLCELELDIAIDTAMVPDSVVDKAWQRFEQAVQQPAAEVANPFAKLNKEGK